MDLTWLDVEQLDRCDIDGAVAVLEAARTADSPHQLPRSTAGYRAALRNGWEGDPPIVALARDADGVVSGVLDLRLPRWDNTHLGSVDVTVDPQRRRQGIGRVLFEAGVERIRAGGRTMVFADCWDQRAGLAFAAAMGLEPAATEAQRFQHLRVLDWPKLDHEREAAERHSGAYEFLRLGGCTPENMLNDLARLTEAINDAPTDDLDIEDEVFSPERIRAFEAAQAARGRRIYRLVARHRDTGELAGQTMVGVESEQPWYAEQWDTSVVRAHRGHRLGLLLKITMLGWLRAKEPQLRVLDTWNAVSNDHMIAVNELLGYEVVATAIDFQRHL